MKKFFLFLCLMLGCINVFAQRQKETTRFTAEFDWDFMGDYTYHYVKQENGKELKDGPFNMKATIDNKIDGYKSFYKATMTGNYTLNGSHSEGYIHGPLTMNANLNFSATNGDKENYTYSFRGNFKKGLPDGNFQVNYPSYGIKVNVNYKDGILVGQYSVSGKNDLRFKQSGTLTADGKLTGVWKFDGGYGVKEMKFSNGILINRSDYDADLSAKAKAFVSGTVSEEQLKKENIYVRKDSLSLGSDAWNQILHSGICFEILGDYFFSQSKYVRYCYLDRLPFFSAEGYEKLKTCLTNAGAFENASFSKVRCEDENLYREFYNGIIGLDKSVGMYCFRLHRSTSLADYCVGYPDWSDYYVNIYITDEQLDGLRRFLHDFRMESIDETPIESLQCSNPRMFVPCSFDENVVAYAYRNESYPGLGYYKIDTFEDYFIELGKYEELLATTPEKRKEIVNAKIEQHKEKLKKASEAAEKEKEIENAEDKKKNRKKKVKGFFNKLVNVLE